MCSVLVESPSLDAACSAAVDVSGKASSSSSSCSATVMAASPSALSALAETCQRDCGDDCDEYASTAASSQPPDETIVERWADLVDSEDEQHESTGASSSQQLPAAVSSRASPSAPRARWADLSDSDDELLLQHGSVSRTRVEAEPSQKGPATLQSSNVGVVDDAVGVSSAVSAELEVRVEAKSKRSKHGNCVEVSAVEALGATRQMHQAGENKASQCPSSSQEEWWPQWQWGSKTSKWWGSTTADWWGSGAGAKCNKRSQQSWASTSYVASRSHRVDHCSATFAKPQCQFFIGIEEEPKFKVTRKILGPHGQHMKAIAEASGAKLRLRGRGSGFLEGPEQRESSDELMLCVSAPDWECYQEAVRLVTELLEGIYDQYRIFCRRTYGEVSHLQIRIHEGPRPGSR
mmetsp:Transcript_24403/g.64878  ORF Transcript_24403/g.64878 Transcript_24403/m.64878 type:complete len:405 (+) Transcript_24403:62-1276(+)